MALMVVSPGIECIGDGRLPPNLTEKGVVRISSLYPIWYASELTSLEELSIGNGNLMAGWNRYFQGMSSRLTRVHESHKLGFQFDVFVVMASSPPQVSFLNSMISSDREPAMLRG